MQRLATTAVRSKPRRSMQRPPTTPSTSKVETTLTAQLTVPQGISIQGPHAGVNPNTYAGPSITQAVVDGGISDQLLLISSTSPVSLEGLQFNHMLIQAYNGPAISLSDRDYAFTNIPVASDGANDLFFANSPTFDFIDKRHNQR